MHSFQDFPCAFSLCGSLQLLQSYMSLMKAAAMNNAAYSGLSI